MAASRLLLVPTDFSDVADHAMNVARDLAVQLGASILLLHVVRFTDYALGEGVYVAIDSIRGEIMKLVGTDIEARARRLREGGVACETKIVEGPPEREIAAVIATTDPLFVIMGTHGRTGFRRLFLGSIAQGVVARSAKPVLLVPPRAEAAPAAR